MTDERGLRVAARGLKMIIPSELQFTAERLMKSQGRTGTADNDINAIVSMGMVPQGYRVNNYLTDSDAFYIITDVPNGMKMFTRAPLTTAMEGDFDTGNVRYKARERYSFGVSDPQRYLWRRRCVILKILRRDTIPPHFKNRKKKCTENNSEFKYLLINHYADFIIECVESPLDIENAIIDRLGKSDITWEYLGEMHDPRVQQNNL